MLCWFANCVLLPRRGKTSKVHEHGGPYHFMLTGCFFIFLFFLLLICLSENALFSSLFAILGVSVQHQSVCLSVNLLILKIRF